MEDFIEELNYDYNYNLFLAKCHLSSLASQQDRLKANRWIRKLNGLNRTTQEMELRNDYMFHLANNLHSAQLDMPFNENPPSGPLPLFTQLAGGCKKAEEWDNCCDTDENADERPLLYKKSPDEGAFLAAQPIPRAGAFCYLAVVNKKTS